MSKKCTLEEFIERAKKVHGDKYDYSKVVYVNNSTKVIITCPIHGDFEQKPYKHLIGQGCPSCSKTKKCTTEEFIEKAKEIHGENYDYSLTQYVNNTTKIKIVCPIHGEFEQEPHNHLKGQGCPMCGLTKQSVPIPYDEFIKRAIEKHGDKYEYPSSNEYVNIQIPIPITCKKHGVFYQRPYSHIANCGCPKCAIEQNSEKRKMPLEEFIERASKIHLGKYDYSKVEYINAKEKVCIICPQHGEFWQSPFRHLNGNACPKCNRSISKDEIEIYDYVCKLVGKENVIQGDRNVLDGKELDIYVPSLGVAIEYNGLYWHNTDVVDMHYHIDKLRACKTKGIKLLQVFEDEYKQKKNIVLNKIAHILKQQQNLPKIMGRKCTVQIVNKDIAKDFLTTYHIQGFCPSTVHLGCYYNNTLLGVMSFKQKIKGSTEWELTRFASDYHYVCQGLGGKLFKYFLNNFESTEIKSFADRRWTVDEEHNIYKQLGFTFDKYTDIEYRYYNPKAEGCTRIHKFNCRIHILNKKFGLPLTMTERQMTTALGYKRIYDCGLIKYIYYNNI